MTPLDLREVVGSLTAAVMLLTPQPPSRDLVARWFTADGEPFDGIRLSAGERLFFLKKTPEGFVLAELYYATAIAAMTTRLNGATTVDRVAGAIAGVLRAPNRTVEERLEAVRTLAWTDSPVQLRP